MSEVISSTALRQLVDDWLSQGRLVIGPRRLKTDYVAYAALTDSTQLLTEGFLRPANSIKEFVFPRHEQLYAYRWRGKEIELVDVEAPVGATIILAARPCDAAALSILDPLFNWDFKDEFYNRHRQATAVVTLACESFDGACFCTSVGLGPAAERGSDAMLFALESGDFEARCFTDKGKALFSGKTRTSDVGARVSPGPPIRFDPDRVTAFLKDHFESTFWQEQTLRCLGCGACAYTCPTCHCFDIVDEGNAAGGVRAKNWDSCQFSLFTLHASGHNPRSLQPQRQRQRLLHKFEIYRQKFGEILCTGCGNCTRNCPVSLGVQSVLEAVEETR